MAYFIWELNDSNYLLDKLVGKSNTNCSRKDIEDGGITINKILMNYKVISDDNLINLGIIKIEDRFKPE